MDENAKHNDSEKEPKDKQDVELEEGLEETFPASDPATSTRRHERDEKPKGNSALR